MSENTLPPCPPGMVLCINNKGRIRPFKKKHVDAKYFRDTGFQEYKGPTVHVSKKTDSEVEESTDKEKEDLKAYLQTVTDLSILEQLKEKYKGFNGKIRMINDRIKELNKTEQ